MNKINLKIVCFAGLRKYFGSEAIVPVESGTTYYGIIEELILLKPEAKEILTSSRIAVNEAYEPMADKMIGEILDEAKNRFKLNQVACVHRLGRLEISGCAVVVITGAGHRKEAYDANRYIIDRVKNEVPIWKHEFFADGTSEWGQNCDCVSNADDHQHKHHHETAG